MKDQQSPTDSLNAAITTRNDLAETFITLGQLFSHIKATKLYRFKGYETFKDFIENEHNLSSSLANKLIKIQRLFIDEMDMDEETLKAIGMDRLLMIAPFAEKASWEERDSLLQQAADLPIPELKEVVKALKEEAKADTTDLKKVMIDQFKEQMCNLFNTSWSEVVFKLALFFTTPTKTDPIYLQALKKDVIHLQRRFEEAVSDLTDDAEGHIGAPTSRLANGAEAAFQPSKPYQPSQPQKDVNHGK